MAHHPNRDIWKEALLICHPFGEEKLWAHRAVVNIARQMAEQGVFVLRFDFTGHGDSDGSTENCSVDTYLADVSSALSSLKELVPDISRIGLLGMRFGATIAVQYAKSDSEIHDLILWEPILDGNDYIQELLRINLATQLSTEGRVSKTREELTKRLRLGDTVNVDGYLISRDFYNDCSQLKLITEQRGDSEINCLVAHISTRPNERRIEAMKALASGYFKSTFVRIEEPTFWREIRQYRPHPAKLIHSTLEWWVNSNA